MKRVIGQRVPTSTEGLTILKEKKQKKAQEIEQQKRGRENKKKEKEAEAKQKADEKLKNTIHIILVGKGQQHPQEQQVRSQNQLNSLQIVINPVLVQCLV